MSKKAIKISELPTFDPARYLRDDKDIAAYLTQVIEDGDFGELAQALGVAARARGMTQIAETTGIGRESLYKALRAGASPRFDTIAKVCKALGVRLVVQAEHLA
ncbi:addiction module antidote protein [Achromobacter xylosoxidans]|jgi:probable addiction module antidote protein|uniref:addiction module antidote protein n=1 Tax=Achromobacter TaxID=222 RepID=UPI0006BFDE42|nr:addiction module antidote protein [Achromobacter xylosoxidans]MCH1985630.1 putative addiction module antidote protein [Achromobacter xylosoxidans]MCH4587654.1 putative addiction module antidote protein [Achromobacter xylosoxidans]WPQ35517.1 addiction module antidote protein [Achromobacter xylosoxidans]CUI91002.1 Predicted transcriptional regulator [Achromobacter xylosoxidans]